MKAGLSELDIKVTFLRTLRADRRINRNAVLASEYVLGRLPCRADLAVWNGEFIGIEVKSARDSLSRLPAQLDYYRACFDRVVVVADDKHIDGVLALTQASEEVWRITNTGRATKVQDGSSASANARTRLQLLKLPQLRELACCDAANNPRRSELIQRALSAPPQAIKMALVRDFCIAYGKSSFDFWSSVGRRAISKNHVEALSPCAAARRRLAERQHETRLFWERWRAEADAIFGTSDTLNLPSQPQLMQTLRLQPAYADEC